MDITSFVYLAFVALSLLIYWILPKKLQWMVLLVCSICFYVVSAVPYTYLYMLLSVVTVWLATLYFEKSESTRKKKVVLVTTILINIGMLAVLKYTNLGIGTINTLFGGILEKKIERVSFAASLGISFYTLQIVAYLLDTYWKVTEIERNPFRLLLFISYFPLMISGPISSHAQLGHQLFEEHRFEYTRVTRGMKRIAWGLVKKLAISNRLAMIVNELWGNIGVYHGVWIWIAAIGYAFQLYTDFSGCMDIIIGVSECFGIQLAENFRAPFLAKTIQEFWQRWHISLGQWLRDYIMNPLLKSEHMGRIGELAKKKFGKKKGKKVPVYLSMLVMWFAMGLWHGESWKYIIGEGLWFWAMMVLAQMFSGLFKRCREKLRIQDGRVWNTVQVIRTIFIFSVGMLFFRASSLTDSVYRIYKSFELSGAWTALKRVVNVTLANVGRTGCLILMFSMGLLAIYDYFLYQGIDLFDKLAGKRLWVRWAVYIVLVGIILTSYNVTKQVFAYAQF